MFVILLSVMYIVPESLLSLIPEQQWAAITRHLSRPLIKFSTPFHIHFLPNAEYFPNGPPAVNQTPVVDALRSPSLMSFNTVTKQQSEWVEWREEEEEEEEEEEAAVWVSEWGGAVWALQQGDTALPVPMRRYWEKWVLILSLFKTVIEKVMFLTTLITLFLQSSPVLCSKPLRPYGRE